MSDPRQVVRQLDILGHLQVNRYGITTEALAEEYGVTIRTLQRDLGDLKEAGFIIRRRRPDGRLTNHLELPANLPTAIPFTEMAALLFMGTLTEALVGTPFHDALHSLTRRLLRAMPEGQRAFLRRAASVYSPHARGRKPFNPQARKIVADLNRAVLAQRVCRVVYHSVEGGRTKTYPIEPLRLLYYMEAGGLYLIARVPPHEEPITLAVERIRDLRPTSARFAVADSVHAAIDQRLADTFGIISGTPCKVRIRFVPEQAPYIRERLWHPTQRLEEQDDGGVIAVFEAASPYELRSWVLSH
ncbi:MAG: transcriptional regulator, partial [Candidatus Latescibacterota bacterium]